MVIPYGFKSRLSHQSGSLTGGPIFKIIINAGMAELADALDSGSNGRKAVQVQVLLPAPKNKGLHPQSFVFSLRKSTQDLENGVSRFH